VFEFDSRCPCPQFEQIVYSILCVRQRTTISKRRVNMDEKPWFKSYDPGLPHTLQPYPERTLLDVIGDTLSERPEHTALIFKGKRMSYAELERHSNAWRRRPPGRAQGDRVALCCSTAYRPSPPIGAGRQALSWP
jgi:hypothetical protein